MKRVPGPGPLLSRVWYPIAEKWLNNTNIVLQTDSARAYKVKIPGVADASVVHQKKKVNGKWLHPKYVEEASILLPDGRPVEVKKGTQLIDGWWRILRKEFSTANKLDSASVLTIARSAQWKRWHMNEDHWLETGKVVQRYFQHWV